MNEMHKYLEKGIIPNYPFYKFLILNTNKYTKEIIDILTDVIGEVEVVQIDKMEILFYFNNVDADFKSLIKTINDDFYTDATLFESAKVAFSDTNEFKAILNLYKEANLNKYVYSSNSHLLKYIINSKKNLATSVAPLLLNKALKDESLLMLANTFFECDLNTSLTSKNIYMHRNTINYKLEQIKSEAGLDIRKFKDAVVLYEFLKLL